ncbi:MAG TPA: phosphatase PAP2 family protein [Tepidisphaeraceae bacterium]|jgi:undecaprenyl-diphosphatase
MPFNPRAFIIRLRDLAAEQPLTLSAVLVVVAGIWILIALTDHVTEGHSEKFDMGLIRWFHAHRGPPALRDAGRDLTALGGITVLTLVTSAVTGFLLISRKRGAAVLVAVAVLGGLGIGNLLKSGVHRDRPPREFQEAYVFTKSYPSGHSMLSAVTYLTIGALLAQVTRGRRLKIYIILVALLVTFLVGLSRVYLGVHYPTDVLAGWTAGLVWSIACLFVARTLQKRGAVETEGETDSPMKVSD